MVHLMTRTTSVSADCDLFIASGIVYMQKWNPVGGSWKQARSMGLEALAHAATTRHLDLKRGADIILPTCTHEGVSSDAMSHSQAHIHINNCRSDQPAFEDRCVVALHSSTCRWVVQGLACSARARLRVAQTLKGKH